MTRHWRLPRVADRGKPVLRQARVVLLAFLAFALTFTGMVVTAAPAQALPLTISVTITRVAECCPGGPIDLTTDRLSTGRDRQRPSDLHGDDR